MYSNMDILEVILKKIDKSPFDCYILKTGKGLCFGYNLIPHKLRKFARINDFLNGAIDIAKKAEYDHRVYYFICNYDRVKMLIDSIVTDQELSDITPQEIEKALNLLAMPAELIDNEELYYA